MTATATRRDYDRDRYWSRDRNSTADMDAITTATAMPIGATTATIAAKTHRDRDRSYRPMNWTSSDSDYRSSRPSSRRDYERAGYSGYDRDYSSRGGFGGANRDGYMSPTGPSFGYGGHFGDGTSSGYGSGGYEQLPLGSRPLRL